MEEKFRQRGERRRRRPFFEIRSGKQGGGTRERSKFSPSFFPFPPISIERHKGGREGSKIGAFRIFSGSENREEEEQSF